ncbi:MAG: STAS domain-containing protein [Leptospiraceae bacterium]|nr:STAS domain-containing protein [Leptospiraceae bacterium]
MSGTCEVIPSYDYACPVLHIKGEFTQDMEKDLEQHYLTIPEARRNRVVLDFTDTRYINSSGIAILIALITRATDESSSLEFAGLSAHFRKVMEIVGLDDFVKMHEKLEDAVGSADSDSSPA